MLTPGEVRALLTAHGLAPSKSFGQNFVVDPNTVRKVVRDAGVGDGDLVVEVGTREAEPADEATFSDEDEDEDADSDQVQTGQASWYINGTGYTAAHRTLPKGTVVTVTNLANGASVQVTINDRGPYIDGRVIDLNQVAFDKIADLGDGVIDVRVSW